MAIALYYPNLISLGGVQLTDESRGPVGESRDERSVVVDLASGRKRKFVKGVRKSWTIDWDMVPMHGGLTIDGHGGRNEIRSLAQGASTLIFTFGDNYNALETYTVFVSDYSENIALRRGEGSRFKISLGLEEQG